jgi:hypothetical protein
MQILVLDKGGQPLRWSSVEDAITAKCKNLIAWDYGDTDVTLHGGIARATGLQSQITVKSIIAVKGKIKHDPKYLGVVSRRKLFQRDKCCTYCLGSFPESYLSVDHIIPLSKGGLNTWTNIITACIACNQKKGARTPEEAGMKLHFVPYIPNKYEHLILANRRILADQMEFLLTGVPKHSRLI